MRSRMLKAFGMSSKTLCLPLLVIILVNHALLSKSSIDILEGGKYYRKELPIKTITVDDGDIYDCMKLDSQPSIRTLQLEKRYSDKKRDSRGQPESESCPPGSVAVLKATKGGPLNFSAIEEFASSRARSFLKSKTIKPLVDNDDARVYAQVSVDGTFGGGEGTLSIWEPRIEDNGEMSISQIWVLSETNSDISMSLEAGWMIQPNLYGDASTRFFIFTTNDNYDTCLYNDYMKEPFDNHLEFRRVNDYMPFGKRLEPSTFDGPRSEIQITIKQSDSEDWGVWVDGILIGFWPKSNYRVGSANRVEWGGEVLNHRTWARHTSTQMGSGHFSTEPIGRVAYISKMGLYDLNQQRYDAPQEIEFGVDRPNCYDLRYWHSEEHGPHITFGGPGYDPEDCP